VRGSLMRRAVVCVGAVGCWECVAAGDYAASTDDQRHRV